MKQPSDEATLIRHGLNQFKEHIDFKLDVRKHGNNYFTKAINDKKSDTGPLKAIGIANTVKEQVDKNKENQGILAQATVKANDKIILQLEKQTAHLYAALMAKHPQQQPLQDTTTATIKALTDKINQFESGSGKGCVQYRTLGSSRFLRNSDGGQLLF
jgi:hypothetical protein